VAKTRRHRLPPPGLIPLPARPKRRREKTRWGWGGRRPGAGRPKDPNAGVPHLERPTLGRDEAAHVVWKLLPEIGSLAKDPMIAALREACGEGDGRFGLEILHVGVLDRSAGAELHVICRAPGRRALAHGLQGLGIRIAKAMNRVLARKGKAFADRYAVKVIDASRDIDTLVGRELATARWVTGGGIRPRARKSG
jgi:hypothetical protein